MKIHVSHATAEHLDRDVYDVEERGTMDIKGKGNMKTYWILGKKIQPPIELLPEYVEAAVVGRPTSLEHQTSQEKNKIKHGNGSQNRLKI